MWLDWAIFDILGNNIFNKRIPNDWQLLGLFWKPHSYVKTSLATFWATIGKIGILFTPTSGHTGLTTFPFLLIKELSSERDQCDQIWRNSTSLAKFKKSWVIFLRLISIWQTLEPNLANFYAFMAIFCSCKWANIEKWSSHLVTLPTTQEREKIMRTWSKLGPD